MKYHWRRNGEASFWDWCWLPIVPDPGDPFAWTRELPFHEGTYEILVDSPEGQIGQRITGATADEAKAAAVALWGMLN